MPNPKPAEAAIALVMSNALSGDFLHLMSPYLNECRLDGGDGFSIEVPNNFALRRETSWSLIKIRGLKAFNTGNFVAKF